MSKFVEIEGYDGPIFVEIDGKVSEEPDTKRKSGELSRRPGGAPSKHDIPSLPGFLETITVNGKAIMEKMQTLSPNSVEVTFGIKLGAEAGTPILGLAKVSGESNIGIKLTWSKKDDETEPTA